MTEFIKSALDAAADGPRHTWAHSGLAEVANDDDIEGAAIKPHFRQFSAEEIMAWEAANAAPPVDLDTFRRFEARRRSILRVQRIAASKARRKWRCRPEKAA